MLVLHYAVSIYDMYDNHNYVIVQLLAAITYNVSTAGVGSRTSV